MLSSCTLNGAGSPESRNDRIFLILSPKKLAKSFAKSLSEEWGGNGFDLLSPVSYLTILNSFFWSPLASATWVVQ